MGIKSDNFRNTTCFRKRAKANGRGQDSTNKQCENAQTLQLFH